MKTFKAHDMAIVLIMTSSEAYALQKRLKQNTGLKKTKPLKKVEEKLMVARGII